MASVGTLTAGVAHEINNPLAAVVANLDLIAEELREIAGGSPSARFLELLGLVDGARQGAERVRRIVRGLKTFSRADDGRPALLDVRQILDVSVNLAFNEIRHRARLTRDYRDVPPVLADEGKLAQLFINLLVNAAQAIPEGQADRNEIHLSTGRDARGRALVEVRDTGSGMSREVLDRVFDPFFTTKAVPEMTGMDLHAELCRCAPQHADRMIFVTGGAFTPAARAFLDRVPNERLDKPVDAKNLRAIVQRFLQ